MSTDAGSNVGTTTVRVIHRFDEAALACWLTANVDEFAGPLKVEQFRGGQSNPTYLLITPARRYVLRRKPPGQVLKGAHAVDREARVLTSLASVGFPVPRVLGLCMDDAVIGTWFYIMEMVEGRIYWDATLPDVPHNDRPAYFNCMNATISELHRIDIAQAGLEDYGPRGNYLERQLRRWSRQYLEDPKAGRSPYMDRLLEWLPAHIPEDGDVTSVVHGDFRIDNLVFHPTEPRVVAVLDWELSTLGHPLVDFAYHAMMYRTPPHIVAGLAGADLATLNIPDEASYAAAYARRAGLERIEHYDYYLAFNFFRVAAILHGIRGRAMRGTASSMHAQERSRYFPDMARLAWQCIEQDVATPGLSVGTT